METRKPIKRKFHEGTVISNKMDKTVTVKIERRVRHSKLEKEIILGKKYYAHNEDKEIPVGAKVRIVETRPLSKLKRWRVVEVIG